MYDIYAPKQELPIQIADIDGVHVDDMDVLEAGESKVGKDFAS